MLAPVLISVYHRENALRQSVAALSRNALACETDLFVVSDAAGRPQDEEKVAAIRTYVRSLKGFKSVTLIARERNLGANKSVMGAIKDLVNQFGRLIFFEDDIIVSKYFLEYMNDCLDLYVDREDVFAVCGYRSDFKLPKEVVGDTMLLPRYSPWGVGFWSDKYNKIDHNERDRYNEMRGVHGDMFGYLSSKDPGFMRILKGDSEGSVKAADVRIEYDLICKGLSCVYPRQTMTNVQETGAEAMHQGMSWRTEESLCQRKLMVEPLKGLVDQSVMDLFYEEKYPTLWQRFRNSIRRNGVKATFSYYKKRLVRGSAPTNESQGYKE